MFCVVINSKYIIQIIIRTDISKFMVNNESFFRSVANKTLQMLPSGNMLVYRQVTIFKNILLNPYIHNSLWRSFKNAQLVLFNHNTRVSSVMSIMNILTYKQKDERKTAHTTHEQAKFKKWSEYFFNNCKKVGTIWRRLHFQKLIVTQVFN